MDVFIEHMVQKKKNITDYVKILATLVIGLILIFVVSVVFMSVPYIASFMLLAVAGVIYLMYQLITSINVEYEYALVNSELDVDKILNAKKRKSVCSVNLRHIDYFGSLSDSEYERFSSNPEIKKVYACTDKTDVNTKFIVFSAEDEKKMLLFDPNEKMIERVEFYNRRRV